MAAVLFIACAIPPAPPPRAEFIVATADSAYWVRADAAGVRVRGVPMTLARRGGRFYEVYVADLDTSFTDAIFTGERLYVRDLLAGDSAMVYEDTTVIRLAARHRRASPGAQPLAPDEDSPDDPRVTVTGETDILDVRGPYLLLEHRSSVERNGDEHDDTTRTAVDLRTGRGVPLKAAVGDTTVHDTAWVRTLPRRWRRDGYDVLARGDSLQQTVSFLLRDRLRRTWPVVTVEGDPRVYWLDTPSVDATVRRALLHAFNDAATYDDAVRYVRRVVPRGVRLRPPVARYAGGYPSGYPGGYPGAGPLDRTR